MGGCGVSAPGQSVSSTQVRCWVPRWSQADQALQLHWSAVQGGWHAWASAGLGSAVDGQSNDSVQERVCWPSIVQTDQALQNQVSLTHGDGADPPPPPPAANAILALTATSATLERRQTDFRIAHRYCTIGNVIRGNMATTRTPLAIAPAAVARLRRKLLAWYGRHGADFLWRRSPTPYRVLVAEVMLQQTQVARVQPKYRQFIVRYPSLRSLAAADSAELLTLWSGLGYNRRALMLRACARTVARNHRGRLPEDFRLLVALPGIGAYTARAINVFARNRDEVCVDTNVRRVLTHELRLPRHLTPSQLELVARRVLPPGRSREWHSALMDYGRLAATGRVTGVRPAARRPAAFVGSSRYYRGRLLKRLVNGGALTVTQAARELTLGVPAAQTIIRALERDGLIVCRGRRVSLPD